MKITKEIIIRDMRKGIVEIVLKDSNEELTLRATLVNIVMSQDKIPDRNHNAPLQLTTFVACYDVDKKDWLTFDINNVFEYKGIVKVL